MSWIGLFIFVFLENFWWTAGILFVVCIIVIAIFGGGKNVNQMTADEKYYYANELFKQHVPSLSENYTSVVIKLSFLIFCLCFDWFFLPISNPNGYRGLQIQIGQTWKVSFILLLMAYRVVKDNFIMKNMDVNLFWPKN